MFTDESPGSHDAFVGTSINNQILKNWKGPGAKRLDCDRLALLEGAHIDLAGCTATGPLGNAVDDDTAGAADSLAAIALKCNRFLARNNQPVVDDVEHLQKRASFWDVARVDILKMPGSLVGLLTPES